MTNIPTDDSGSVRKLVGPAIAVTILGAGVQGTTFIVQMILARLFGAGAEVDAYFAASTLPQYLVTVLVGTLPVVFIPVVAAYDDAGELWRIARGVLVVFASIMGAIAAIGMVFASPLLHITTPGLAPRVHELAVTIARLVWPSVIASAAVALLTGAFHARGSFTRPAVIAGTFGVLNIALVFAFGRAIGIAGVALATTLTAFAQMLALTPRAIYRNAREALRSRWSHPAVREVLALLWPLAVSNILIRSSIVVERFLASEFSEGAIAQVTYASRVLALISYLLANGLATVTFPAVARSVAGAKLDQLAAHLNRAIRLMLLAVAPATAIGIALALPLVKVIFERGRFTPADSIEVAALLRIYLLAMAGGCLGTITARVLYALKMTRFIAIIGAVEAACYVGYTALLVRRLGISGVAWGFVAFATLSVVWQIVVIRKRVGWRLPSRAVLAVLATMIAAGLAGFAASFLRPLFVSPWAQLAGAGGAALALYALSAIVIDRIAAPAHAPEGLS